MNAKFFCTSEFPSNQIYFIFINLKWTTAKSKDDYSSSLGFSMESKDSREEQTTKSYNPEEKTVSFISTYSDTTIYHTDQIGTTISDLNDQDSQSKKRRNYFGC